MSIMLTRPVNRAIWKRTKATYAPELMAWVDGLIEQIPLVKPVDVVAQFKVTLAEVMGRHMLPKSGASP